MQEINHLLTQINLNWSLIEVLAVIFSIIYVILAAKENIWCWTAAAISVLLYIYICYTAKLFPETALQVFYFIMAMYGYYNWNKYDASLRIKEWSAKKHLFIIFLGALLTFLMGFYFTTYTSAKMPIVDSVTTVFSILATYMVTKKVLENWLYWIVIDIVSVYLYFSRDLHLTSVLFVVYTTIAIFGYFVWLKQSKANA
jgi:nicotinamide mononucleotide transporter